MTTDLYYSPLTDQTVMELAMQQSFHAGACYAREGDSYDNGDTAKPTEGINYALAQRVTCVPEWWKQGVVRDLHLIRWHAPLTAVSA